jgi:hypothetical protein
VSTEDCREGNKPGSRPWTSLSLGMDFASGPSQAKTAENEVAREDAPDPPATAASLKKPLHYRTASRCHEWRDGG